jgi:hypothetical protein
MTASESAKRLLKMIQTDVGKKGYIAGIIKYSFLLLIVVKIILLIFQSKDWNNNVDYYVLNIIFPAFQFIFFVFTLFKFRDFWSIGDDTKDSYKKFKTLIFWISFLSIFQLIYNFSIFLGQRRQQDAIQEQQEAIDEAIKQNSDQTAELCQTTLNEIQAANIKIKEANKGQKSYFFGLF